MSSVRGWAERGRRCAAAVLASIVVGAFVIAIPAGAQSTTQTAPEAYVASASARGLDINLLGTKITIGASQAGIDSTLQAKAQGAGVLNPLIGGTVANAAVNGADQTSAPPKACLLNLPLLGLLSVATACGEAKAA